MPVISGLGAGSGLPLENVLSQLTAAENTRLAPYQSQQNKFQNQISAWGAISSLMNSLHDTTKKLSGDVFNTLTASQNTAFTATPSTDASEGSYSVIVDQLATAHSIATAPNHDIKPDDDLGSDSGSRNITITQGTGDNAKEIEVTLDSDQTSLKDIAAAINKQNSGVTASVVQSDDGAQLVLSSKNTGTDNEIQKIEVSGDDKLQDILGYDQATDSGNSPDGGKMYQKTEAQDAHITVNGTGYTKSSNKIDDVIPGVTLNLNKVSETDKDDPNKKVAEQLVLTPDYSAAKDAIKAFVDNYNKLLDEASMDSKWGGADNDSNSNSMNMSDDEIAANQSKNGPLMGDTVLRRMLTEIRGDANGTYGDGDEDTVIQALADLGITGDSKNGGHLTLDESKLDAALKDHPDQVKEMFIGTEDKPGLAKKMDKDLLVYLGDPNAVTEDDKKGLIKLGNETLDDQVTLVKKQIESTQKQIDAQVERYRIQFQNLDMLVSQLQSSSGALSSMLSGLQQ